jgi:subtilisin family serine protease
MARRPGLRELGLLGLSLVVVAGAEVGPYERPSDPDFVWQWGLENRGQPIRRGSDERGTVDADIDGVEAFAAGHTGRGVILALVGQGFRYRGSSLEPVLWRNAGEIPGNGIDDDGNRFVDDVVGYDFGDHDADPTFPSRHDLVVSEIALAPHDDRTIAGIAPEARLMILKVTDRKGELIVPALFRALRYAVDHGARVLLLPWTLRGQNCDSARLSLLTDVFDETARHAFIVGGHPADWPACLRSVVSIQATDAHDRPKAGRHASLDLSAPGSDGRTPVAVSYAIGVVAGAAALLFSQDPSRTPSDVRERLLRTADRVHPELAPYLHGWNDRFGAGRLNLARALGTNFDGDTIPDADDPDADGDGIREPEDRCPLDPHTDCPGPEAAR